MCSVLHWLTVVSQGGRAWCESGSTQNSSSLFQPGHTVPNKLSCAKFSDHIFPADLACVYDLLGKRSLTGQSLESDWTGFVSWLPKHLMAAQNTQQQRTQVPEGIPPQLQDWRILQVEERFCRAEVRHLLMSSQTYFRQLCFYISCSLPVSFYSLALTIRDRGTVQK